MTGAATYKGVVSLKDHLRELCVDEGLLPSLHTELQSSWVTVEDKLVIGGLLMSVHYRCLLCNPTV